ncbi:MAG: HEPN domain-containing protein [Sulfuricurvum sp.]|jgi:HEPN domain-containing protein|uniref:HEPN domain-containing protein n=1 Tax=Sulfuricurvum sp. TaxID=2025608 RepID=UPI0025CEFD43|nr:HEPN domain-containing protein [Sulfuricurvum sp.]MCK9374316.1 HEPN domain-containing protein [Sulfuricurvum sp.]
MNAAAAKEWLTKAWHHYSSGRILYDANHYTDTIGVDLHYAIEITLKSFLAYENKKILKTHNLLEIAELVKAYMVFSDEESVLLSIITKYHIKGSYPTPHRKLPSRDEIKKVLEFADQLLDRVCTLLNISTQEIKSEPN